MNLTAEQQAILNGEKGDTLARIMKTLIRYGELFGADSMISVTSKYNHLVTSFGSGSYFSLLLIVTYKKTEYKGSVAKKDQTPRDLVTFLISFLHFSG